MAKNKHLTLEERFMIANLLDKQSSYKATVTAGAVKNALPYVRTLWKRTVPDFAPLLMYVMAVPL